MTKHEIRRNMMELKRNLSVSKIQLYSDNITKQLVHTSTYTKCTHLFCYVSFNQEVITTTIIKSALSQNKKVAVPKIIGEEMKFYFIKSLEELRPGTLGILEPITELEAVPQKGDENLVIVPGLAFDLNRNRIGYGKGYYDRYIMKHEEIHLNKIALAFDIQVIEELPVDAFDKKIDQIITQTRVIS